MRSRKTAAWLALVSGALGGHRFYLGQPWVGVACLGLFFLVPLGAVFIGWIDAYFLFRQEDPPAGAAVGLSSGANLRKRAYVYIPLLVLFAGWGSPLISWILPTDSLSIPEAIQFELPEGKLPIFYRKDYNIHFFGLEKLHPFDSQKYRGVRDHLVERRVLTSAQLMEPPIASEELLLRAHTPEYMNSLRSSLNLGRILEIPQVALLPWQFTDRQVLRPMRYATSGTVLAALSAMKRGWAINLGGGFHHASKTQGGGFCPYADISLAIHLVREKEKRPVRAMIIDLDAHQGNGHERDFLGDPQTFILDAYNPAIYPHDKEAEKGISLAIEVRGRDRDEQYLARIRTALQDAEARFKPEIVIYNAGTDILEGDPLGDLHISPEGILRRDEMVFRWALAGRYPVVMVLSGGYQKSNASIIGRSVENLIRTVGLK